jgi:hypothetical protein
MAVKCPRAGTAGDDLPLRPASSPYTNNQKRITPLQLLTPILGNQQPASAVGMAPGPPQQQFESCPQARNLPDWDLDGEKQSLSIAQKLRNANSILSIGRRKGEKMHQTTESGPCNPDM